jgi:hypothetical protein
MLGCLLLKMQTSTGNCTYKPICVAPLQSIFDQFFDHAWGYSARGLHTFSPGRGSAWLYWLYGVRSIDFRWIVPSLNIVSYRYINIIYWLLSHFSASSDSLASPFALFIELWSPSFHLHALPPSFMAVAHLKPQTFLFAY